MRLPPHYPPTVADFEVWMHHALGEPRDLNEKDVRDRLAVLWADALTLQEALRLLNPTSGPSRKKIITLARLAAGPPPHLRSHDRPSPHAEAVVAMALKEQEP